MGTDVCRDPDAVDAPRQLIHPPIDKVDHAAEQIGASVRLGRRSLGGGTCEARYDQFTAMCHFDKAGYEAGNSRRSRYPAGIHFRGSLL